MTDASFDPAAVKVRLEAVRERIASTGANPDGVKVVAVTKGFGAEAVEAAVAAGFASVGENYAQEAAAKYEAIGELQVEWHFIGQLQRNKVKALAPFIDVWQTVDNAALAQEIAKRVPNARIFIQVNLTSDPARGGCDWDRLDNVCSTARAAGLDVRGLMGVAPQSDEPAVRAAFRRLADENNRLGLQELSMGMSGDYEIAIEEGATVVRLGSTLFGPRPPRPS